MKMIARDKINIWNILKVLNLKSSFPWKSISGENLINYKFWNSRVNMLKCHILQCAYILNFSHVQNEIKCWNPIHCETLRMFCYKAIFSIFHHLYFDEDLHIFAVLIWRTRWCSLFHFLLYFSKFNYFLFLFKYFRL